MKILLVDDETAILDTLEILFRGEGYEVAVADSGPKALAALQDERPDIVLTVGDRFETMATTLGPPTKTMPHKGSEALPVVCSIAWDFNRVRDWDSTSWSLPACWNALLMQRT